MAAAEGLEEAVKELSRFWRQAEVHLERVRVVSELEAEVYERLVLPGESLPTMTLVRRESETSPWKVVCINEAYDERFVLWLPTRQISVDDAALAESLPEGTQLLMNGLDGVLAFEDWLVHARGPIDVTAWPENLPGQTPRIFELATALAPDPEPRRAQLRWLLAGALALLRPLGGAAVYRKREGRVMMPAAIEAVVTGAATPAQVTRFWVRFGLFEGYVFTDGLNLLGLPEVEVPVALFDEPSVATELARWLAEAAVAGREVPLGTEVSLGDRSLLVVRGRRGPRRGRSHGRWGAIALTALEHENTGRGSRSRIRAPDHIAERA